jgi:hypothetical protein
MSDALVSFLLSEVKGVVTEALSDGTLSSNEILNIAMMVVKKASSAVDIAFEEKKALVVKVVETSLKTHLSAEQFELTGARVALDMLPTVLDIAMKAASGHFELIEKVVQTVGWNCLNSCFSAAKKESLVKLPVSIVADAVAVVPAPVVAEVKASLQLLQPVAPSVPEPAVTSNAEVKHPSRGA